MVQHWDGRQRRAVSSRVLLGASAGGAGTVSGAADSVGVCSQGAPVCFGAKPTPKTSTLFESKDFERVASADDTLPDSVNMTFTPVGIGLGAGQLEAWPEEQAAYVDAPPKMVDRVQELDFSTARPLPK